MNNMITILMHLLTSLEFLIVTAIMILAVSIIIAVTAPASGPRKRGRGRTPRVRKGKSSSMPPVVNDEDDEER
jgi:hypothetical protein